MMVGNKPSATGPETTIVSNKPMAYMAGAMMRLRRPPHRQCRPDAALWLQRDFMGQQGVSVRPRLASYLVGIDLTSLAGEPSRSTCLADQLP